MSAAGALLRLWARLDVRLALVVVISLGVLSAVLMALQGQQVQRQQDAMTQWQSLNLARYIADRQAEPLMNERGSFRPDALANIAMYVSMIQPSLEIYLLDTQGAIVQHSLPKPGPQIRQIKLAAVRDLLGSATPQLPIYGDDPNRPGSFNLVSVAGLPNNAQPLGYLYVVLRGEQARLLQQKEANASQRVAAWGIGLLAVALAAGVIVATQTIITRRLRLLAVQLQDFWQPEGQSAPGAVGKGDEIDRVRDAADELQQRVRLQFRRLEDNDRMRRELVSNVSHDLHTPLANIQGYVETLLLRGDQLTADTREQYLRTTLHHCQRLGRRVAELFELSKLESGQTQALLEPFCVAELLNDVVQHQQMAARLAGITLRLTDDSDRNVRVVADIGLIERVLQNLVDNALRHTPRDGLVELTVSVEGSRVRVRVNDSGCGIAEQDLPYIFERYWTTRMTAADATQPSVSSGLGLAIVRRILELHGSSIHVRSALQRGTEFSFALQRPANSVSWAVDAGLNQSRSAPIGF